MNPPGEWQARLIGAGLLVLLIVAMIGAAYWRGERRANFRNVVGTVKTQEQAGEIGRQTADTVAQEQAALERQSQQDEVGIRERIHAQPRAAGPADADVLRIARAAHGRAVCAAGRVQRAECSDAAASGTGQ